MLMQSATESMSSLIRKISLKRLRIDCANAITITPKRPRKDKECEYCGEMSKCNITTNLGVLGQCRSNGLPTL